MKNSKKEITFNKYLIKGSDYHYQEIREINIYKFNAYLYARYLLIVEEIAKSIKEDFAKHNEIKILDVGCGDGVLIYLLRRELKSKNIKYYGIDMAREALKIAENKNPRDCSFNLASAYQIPFEDKFFDIIVSSDTIEHLNYPDKMLSEIKRVGRNDAKIIISTPIRYTENPIDSMHAHEFFPNELCELMQKYFKKAELQTSHKLFFQILYLKTFSIWKFNLPIFQYLFNTINLLFGYNPFYSKVIKSSDYPSYMTVVAVK